MGVGEEVIGPNLHASSIHYHIKYYTLILTFCPWAWVKKSSGQTSMLHLYTNHIKGYTLILTFCPWVWVKKSSGQTSMLHLDTLSYQILHPDPYLLSVGVGEEVIRPHLCTEHDIIIHVDKLFRQTRYAVKVSLDGWRGKCWQVTAVWEDLLEKVYFKVHYTYSSTCWAGYLIMTVNMKVAKTGKDKRDMDQSIYTKLSKFIKLPLHIQFEKKYTSSYSSWVLE